MSEAKTGRDATALCLADRTCVPCKGGVPPLSVEEQAPLLSELGAGWRSIGGRNLEKSFEFKEFKDGLDFVNRVGAIAEEQGHHPDLLLRWGSVRVDLFTHKIHGLSEADFVLAAKIEREYARGTG
jgi:4a-hydroxytetrahydrobiopterin dehydratase